VIYVFSEVSQVFKVDDRQSFRLFVSRSSAGPLYTLILYFHSAASYACTTQEIISRFRRNITIFILVKAVISSAKSDGPGMNIHQSSRRI
jgi:hypothetical protein